MENDESAQHRYGSAINLLRYLPAAWCAIAIIVVGTLLISSAGSQILETLAHPSANVAEFAGSCLVLAWLAFSSHWYQGWH